MGVFEVSIQFVTAGADYRLQTTPDDRVNVIAHNVEHSIEKARELYREVTDPDPEVRIVITGSKLITILS